MKQDEDRMKPKQTKQTNQQPQTLAIAGCRSLPAMARHGWPLLTMAGHCWPLVANESHGWPGQAMSGHGNLVTVCCQVS